MEIDAYLFVNFNKQIKLGCFKQKQHENYDKKVGQKERQEVNRLISKDFQMQI